MKKLYFLFILYLLGFCSFAQHHLIVGVNGTQHDIKTAKLNNFVSTFNSYYQANGFVPLTDFSSKMRGLGFSTGYRLMGKEGFNLGMIYMFSKNGQDNSTTLATKSGYDFNYRAKNHDFIFELGYNIGGLFTINGVFGMGIRGNAMEVWKVYANGDRSFGYENDITGHYKTNSFTMDYGGSVGLKLWKFYVPIRVTYGSALFNKGESVLMDYSTNRYRSNEFPHDFKQWINSNTTYDETNSIGQNEFVGMKISVGLEFMIPLGKK